MKMTFGTLVREARLTKGMSLREAARRLEVSPTYLSQIENGKMRPPMPEVLRRIESLYSIPFDTLLEHAQSRLAQSVEEDAASDRVVAALLRKVLDLDADTRVAALKSILKEYHSLSEPEIDRLVRKLTTDLKRLDRSREGLFAADVSPRRLTRKWIEQAAARFLESYGLTPATYKPPTPVDVLVEKHPHLMLVIDEDLDSTADSKPHILGMSHWHNDEKRRVIKVNPKLADDPSATAGHRYRFTLGHELFHALEHLPRMDQRFKKSGACLREAVLLEEVGLLETDPNSPAQLPPAVEMIPRRPAWWQRQSSEPRRLCSNEDWREWQANVFSSALLMPGWSVRKSFLARFGEEEAQTDEDPRQIASALAEADISVRGGFQPLYELYEVSKQAMAIRLLALGLVPR